MAIILKQANKLRQRQRPKSRRWSILYIPLVSLVAITNTHHPTLLSLDFPPRQPSQDKQHEHRLQEEPATLLVGPQVDNRRRDDKSNNDKRGRLRMVHIPFRWYRIDSAADPYKLVHVVAVSRLGDASRSRFHDSLLAAQRLSNEAQQAAAFDPI